MLKDQEKIRKIAKQCAKDYSLLKNSGVSGSVECPPREWIRAWMQANYNIIKLSGYFYRIFFNEIWNHDDLNESFTSGVIDKAKEGPDVNDYIDMKKSLADKIEKILTDAKFTISHHVGKPEYPNKINTYTKIVHKLPNSDRDLTMTIFRIMIGVNGYSENSYMMKLIINPEVEYDDLPESNTFCLGFDWYATDDPRIAATCNVKFPMNSFNDWQGYDGNFNIYNIKSNYDKILKIIERYIKLKNRIKYIVEKDDRLIKKSNIEGVVRALLGITKKTYNGILKQINESFTSNVIDTKKEMTSKDKRTDLFSFTVPGTSGKTVNVSKSEDRLKNKLFGFLVKYAKINVYDEYDQTYIDRVGEPEYKVDYFITYKEDEDGSRCLYFGVKDITWQSYGTPRSILYFREKMNGGNEKVSPYTLGFILGPLYGVVSKFPVYIKPTRRGMKAKISAYYRDTLYRGPRSKQGKWTKANNTVYDKEVPWLAELY